ncbi:unnamed protein product [Heterobilharzia americana]|nr:unnamed protein product [Heterobilharzia americana]
MFLYASLSSGPGNPWWFGLNRNVVLAVFESCPTLQLCANNRITKTGLWGTSRYHGDNDDLNNTPAMSSYHVNSVETQYGNPPSAADPLTVCEVSSAHNLKTCPNCAVGGCNWCSSASTKNINWQNVNISSEIYHSHNSYYSDQLLHPD